MFPGGGNSYDPGNKAIEYNPNRTYIYDGTQSWHYRPPEVGLGHEAIHSEHDIDNKLGPTRNAEESRTVGLGKDAKEPHTENKIRQ